MLRKGLICPELRPLRTLFDPLGEGLDLPVGEPFSGIDRGHLLIGIHMLDSANQFTLVNMSWNNRPITTEVTHGTCFQIQP